MHMKSTITALILAAAALGAAPAAAQEPIIMRLGSSAWLGFSYSEEHELSNGERTTTVSVTSVVDESPASEAGLREGDQVISINDLRATSRLLNSLSSALEPGDEVQLEIRRDGSTRTVTITAAERPAEYSFSATQVYRFNADSVVALARTMLDSALVRIDSLNLPEIHIEHSGDGSTFFWRDGSVDSMAPRDSVFLYRFFGDSVRNEMNRVFKRVTKPGAHFEFHGDSLIMLDSTAVHLRPFGGLYREAMSEFPSGAGFLRVGMRALAGMTLEEVGPLLGDYFGTERGLLVLEVAPRSPAAEAGLREGDVILNANGTDTDRIGELRDIVAHADGETVTLTVLRQRREIELRLTTEE